MLSVGDKAPDFSLLDQDGQTVTRDSLLGKTVVVYFYPKADTPGCTIESQKFGESHTDFQAENAVIIGVSPDACKAQLKFATKYSLPFRLLADTEHTLAEAFGVWAERSMYGKKYMGIDRTTFLLDESGMITHVFPKVKIEGHAEEVLKAVKEVAAK